MFAIPGMLVLLIITYVRPQVFVPALAGVPLFHLTCITIAIGIVVDLRLRYLRVQRAPLLLPALLFLSWCALTIAIRNSTGLGDALNELFVIVVPFSFISFSVQSFRAFRALAMGLVAIALFLSFIGIEQRLAPTGCIRYKSSVIGTFDGRDCDTVAECMEDKEPGVGYSCEHVGLFGSYAMGGRVRWIGLIQDPNELAMCVSVCLPLLIGLYQLKPGRRRGALTLLGGAAILWCTIYTQSRGGQLVFVSVIGVHFVRRYGVRGLLIGLAIALPVLLLGGRSGGEADQSKLERLEALYVAMTLVVQFPLLGAGFMQFDNYNTLTAHNSYAISAAELGLPGLFFFLTLLYLAGKTSWLAIRRYSADGPARAAWVWGCALLGTQVGFMVGIALLTFNLSPILWIFFATNTAFYYAVKRHDPLFEVRFGWIDAARVAALTVGITTFMYVYSRYKMMGE